MLIGVVRIWSPAAPASAVSGRRVARMQCSYFDAHRCRSCTWMGRPLGEQVLDKQRHCQELLGDRPDLVWLPPVSGSGSGYRNKAKMVVGGTVAEPLLGILDGDRRGVV